MFWRDTRKTSQVYTSKMSDRPSGAEREAFYYFKANILYYNIQKKSQQNLLPTVLFSSTTHGEFPFWGLFVYPLNQEPLRRGLLSALHTNSVCRSCWHMKNVNMFDKFLKMMVQSNFSLLIFLYKTCYFKGIKIKFKGIKFHSKFEIFCGSGESGMEGFRVE